MWNGLSRRLSGPLAAGARQRRRRPIRAALRSLETLEPRRLLSDARGTSAIVVRPESPAVNPGGPMIRSNNPGSRTTLFVDSSFSGSSNGSQSDPFTTIQAAINVANPGDTVLVETGNGYGESDTIDVSNLTVKAADGASPVLDGLNGNGAGFAVTAKGVTISGLPIQDYSGGGIVNDGGTVTVTQSTISDNNKGAQFGARLLNTELSAGGGIDNEAGTMTVTDCTIAGNIASDGGDIYNAGKMTITGCAIANRVPFAGAGGIASDGTLKVAHSSIGGGGISNGSDGRVTVAECSITDGFATLVYGGAISNVYAASSDKDSASAPGFFGGGGIYNAGKMTVIDTTVSGNSAGDAVASVPGSTGGATLSGGQGGGIANTGTMTVKGCTIKGNSAGGDGGGIYTTGTMTINDTVIAANSANSANSANPTSPVAASGGGILIYLGTVRINHSQIKDNSGGNLENDGGNVIIDGRRPKSGDPAAVGSSSA